MRKSAILINLLTIVVLAGIPVGSYLWYFSEEAMLYRAEASYSVGDIDDALGIHKQCIKWYDSNRAKKELLRAYVLAGMYEELCLFAKTAKRPEYDPKLRLSADEPVDEKNFEVWLVQAFYAMAQEAREKDWLRARDAYYNASMHLEAAVEQGAASLEDYFDVFSSAVYSGYATGCFYEMREVLVPYMDACLHYWDELPEGVKKELDNYEDLSSQLYLRVHESEQVKKNK